MEEKHLFNSVEVQVFPGEKTVSIKFLSASKSADFRGAWDKALSLAVKYNCNKWLVNQRHQSIMPEDQKWHETEWFGKSLQMLPLGPSSPRYVSVIPSDNFFVEFSSKKFIKQTTGVDGLEITMFRKEDEAEAWLKER